MYFLPYSILQYLINALQNTGYDCFGPQVRDGAIVYDNLQNANQLPWGIRDVQRPGEYRLEKTDRREAFGFSNGPQAIKPLLFKPRETVWKVIRNEKGKLEFQSISVSEKPVAVIGARSCDLVAMEIQDKVFLEQGHTDIRYQQRRNNLFIVAVNCTYSSDNCFCVSAGTGPDIRNPYDILMTEIDEGFVVESGSDKGHNILQQIKLIKATEQQITHASQRVTDAANMQTKRIPLDNQRGLYDLLFSNLDHPRWEEVANRCLSCGNCTLVCPTCFCHSEVDNPTMDGESCEHEREWDSCFTAGHSYIHGKLIRDDIRKRYRQWLTHKVGSWFEQFDVSGCVGCGRCITWCPVGIDITEELAAISGEPNVRNREQQ